MKITWPLAASLAVIWIGNPTKALPQEREPQSAERSITAIAAVPGYEKELADAIADEWKTFSPKRDNLGNVYVTIGSGAPFRLIAAAMDEPGYVVSGITPDGYLRVQRLPQNAPNAVFDSLEFAQPVRIFTRRGKYVNGVFAGISVHLQPGRVGGPKMNHPDELYVDIGAKNAEEVKKAGIDLLDPIALDLETALARDTKHPEWNAIGNGGKFALPSLLHLPAAIHPGNLKGTLTIAFLTQSWTGGRGLDRILTELHPDELLYVGRVNVDEKSPIKSGRPGEGVLLGIPDNAKPARVEFGAEIQKLAGDKKISLKRVTSRTLRIAGYAESAAFPERFAQIGIPTLFPVTPAESASHADQQQLAALLLAYCGEKGSEDRVAPRDFARFPGSTIQRLTEAYGASGHEGAVREEVKRLLPDSARKRAVTDAAGNLVLHFSDGTAGGKTPRIVFIAHTDEIGYEVKSIEEDGRLQVTVLGGGYTQYFLGHSVLVHTADGSKVAGVLELPEDWEKAGFEWPQSFRSMDEPVHVYVGTKSKSETEQLGIATGDFLTIPKAYRPLLGTRANARSFDDRVGCAALIEAVKSIGESLPGRDVTFVWSTEEEVGLKGAAAYAAQAANDNRVPDFVFAIDTFVSSNSPLEAKRFGDAKIGEGFVVRAVDNSNITPRNYVERVLSFAKENQIPAQYGVTGGGNDGAVFTRYGSVDVALGWPLRYSHSPGEVIDTKDLEALAKIVAVIAKKW